MSSSNQTDGNVFSLRIVSLDYYMSPPIHDLDLAYSTFQGRNVGEVPVIRIYGSTPAGQKACLHIHRALPYLYIPCPENALKIPEEGHKFTHILSNALEKALTHKGSSSKKRQHVHECRLVRAKKLYGYHSSDNLFVKIHLYYPHEVASTAAMLLDGAILKTSFQPYESHIPYLLQFLVDYNLYGMGHVHLSKFKFRPPVPDDCDSSLTYFQKYLIKAHGNSAAWFSSTVPSDSIWPDSSGNLIRRQSTCSLEVDASVNDILNETYKMHTSLSQTGSEVKMVQSLVPIWEEEYERSGIAVAVSSPDPRKPTPDCVLGSFNHGFEYEKALGELCADINRTFPAKVSKIEDDGNLEHSVEYFTRTSKEAVPENHSSCNILEESLKSLEEENESVQLPRKLLFQENKETAAYEKGHQSDGLKSTPEKTLYEVFRNADPKSLDTEALGLLSWLASSQGAEDVSADDEMVHEALLSPLLSKKSYKEALEMAHLDYENASQQECQDILDSLEGFQGVEGSKEQVSCSTDQDFAASVSSDKVIRQVDGSVDDDFRTTTPHKGDLSEANTNSGRNKYSVRQVGGPSSSRPCSKHKRNKPLWGPLPFAERENSEPVVFTSCHDDEPKSDRQSGYSAGHKGDRCCEGLEIYDEKGDWARVNSVRDLMRRKRRLRTEQSDSMMQNVEMINLFPEATISCQSERVGSDVVPQDSPIVESFNADRDCVVCETVTCTRTSTQDACTKDTLQNNYSSPANRNSLVSLSSDQEMQSVPLDKHLHFPKTSCGNEIVMLNASRGFMKTCNNKLSAPSQRSTYVAVENPKVNEDLEFHKREYQSFVEPLEENIDICTKNLSERTSMHDIREKVNQNNVIAESNCPLNKNDQTNKNYVSGDWSHSSLASDCGPCTDFHKREESAIYVEMSFSRKPPSREYVGEYSEDPPGTMRQAENTADINGDFLPFFTSDFEDGGYNLLNDENLIIHQQSVLGVPTHFQNDGSVLYLLTHATLPPTLESVHQWLFEAAQDSCLNVSSGNACDKIFAESSSINCVKPDISTQEGIKVAEDSQGDTKFDEGHETSLYIKENSVKNDYHDFSQISGPESGEKLGLTPLSQIGFRDAASLGGGQQLMLISIEMQAESRADLLPDPKVDAINIISLVIQEDSSHTVEIHVLLRGNSEELCVRNVDGISDCKFSIFNDERLLLDHFVKMISLLDPDILMGWEIQGGSLGFLAERAAHLGIALLKKISRIPPYETKSSTSADPELSNMFDHASVADTISEYSIIEDEWGRTHASGIHVGGRIVLNIWRLMRAELKLHMYSMEAVAEEVLRRKIPSIANRILNRWFLSGPARARYNCIQYVTDRAKLNLDIMSQLDMINRTSELARVFGIDFFSVLSRGSQYRVESMLLRLAHTQNYLAISPGSQQVALQPAMECLPLVMEPESGFYADPVVVLDFQSLYPSMIIAYNLCYTTCLGTIFSSKTNILGVTSYLPDPLLLKDIRQELLLSPNGIMYVPSKVRKGVMPRLLEEILSTRIMVKQAMKKLMPSQQVLQRVFNARQLALKLIANVTYGYTAAGFSGRMPCAELADSIVQCGRRTLETAITFVNQHDKWKAQVIYGDTDSMFVLLKGRSREEAFRIGNEIASAITAINPNPVTLKMEKVYHPCFLLTKKRYVGYSYETPDQEKPIFDAKGIETVRRDTCPAVAKTLERSIRLIFEHQDISVVKTYLQRQWRRILSGKISLQDFIFSKEVRLGTYSTRASSLPPAAIVALKAMRTDPRADPKYGDRIPYIVIHGEPGARLVDMVIDPHMLLDINSPYRLNDLYYIRKQLIPALQRVLGLVGADLSQWFSELPRPIRTSLAKGHAIISCSGSLYESDGDIRSENSKKVQAKRSRIDTYYVSKHCTLCGELAQGSAYLCSRCLEKDSLVAAAVVGKTSKLEREIQRFAAVCRHCGGGDWVIERGVKCTSLACSVFYERRKVQKELQAVSSFATEAGFYPRCNAEWF